VLRRPVVPGCAYTLAELRWGILHEFAVTLGDLLIRRIPIAFELRDSGRAAAREVAPLVRRWLGWSEAETAAELARFDAEVTRMFGVDL
jgi:glycerol-3-phosphate dehydrogenase